MGTKIKINDKPVGREVIITFSLGRDLVEDLRVIGGGKLAPGIRNILESYEKEIKQAAKDARKAF